MSSGDFIEGNCQQCGSYTKGSTYQWTGLCLACTTNCSISPHDYDLSIEEDTYYFSLNSDTLKYDIEKIKENEQYLVDRIRSLYNSYNEFREIKFMLNTIGYEIETYPELRIWKEM